MVCSRLVKRKNVSVSWRSFFLFSCGKCEGIEILLLLMWSSFGQVLTSFLAKDLKLYLWMLLLKKKKEKKRQSKIWLNIVLRENFWSMNIFDFRIELKWVILANYIRCFSSLLYYCAFIYCYSWYLCVCLLCLGALIADLIVHGVILPNKETVTALESLRLSWFWWCADLQQIRLRCSSPTLVLQERNLGRDCW